MMELQEQLAIILSTLARAEKFEAHCVVDSARLAGSLVDPEDEATRRITESLAFAAVEKLKPVVSVEKSVREEGDFGPGSFRHSIRGFFLSEEDMNTLARALRAAMRAGGYDPREVGYY